MVRRWMRSDAPLFTDSDYNFIMQCRDGRPKHKVLKDLTEKYGTSSKRIYQIWRGEEDNRIAWDQPFGTVLKQTPVIDLYAEEGVPALIERPERAEGSDAIIQFPPKTLSETLKATSSKCPLGAKAGARSLPALLSKKTGQKKKAVIGDSETVRSQLLSERLSGRGGQVLCDRVKTSPVDNLTRIESELEDALNEINERTTAVGA